MSKRFGSRVILDNIDLSIGRGEVLVLVGPSGSGKSTLLKIVSGIETADAGQVFLAGSECTHLPPYRRAVHTVFQSYALFPHLDVSGNVAFPLAIAGVPRAEQEKLVETALGWVKLERHVRRRVEGLSGGERQRVALARALVDSPACVLLDEPLSALDPHLRAETCELLTGIQSRLGTTFLFITHDREEALRLGHRIGVLNHGRLEQVGRPEEVYEQPRTAFVASFLGKINWMNGEVVSGGEDGVIIAGQRVACSRAKGMMAGKVKIGVRPEDVVVGANGSLSAQVIGRQFLGDSVVLQLRLSDGTVVCADQRAPVEGVAVGARVGVSWVEGVEHVFAEDAGERQAEEKE